MSSTSTPVRLLAGLAFIAATFSFTALDVAATPQAAHAASSPDGKITRSEVLARAQNWVDRNVRYNLTRRPNTLVTDAEGDNKYGPDCSGLVSMAWHITANSGKGGNSTVDFAGYSGKITLGSLHDLKPGDAILRSGHMELFARWKNEQDHSQGAWTYSLNGGSDSDGDGWEDDWAKGPAVNSHGERGDESWASMQSYTPIRYKNIVDDHVPGHGADFNGDGIGDIFSAATGTLNVWNGRGSNNFAARQEIGGGWSAFSKPVAGDFNDDGVSDLAAIKGGSTLHIWNGEGGNRFGPAVEIGGGWAPFDGTLTSIGDVNRDGHDDIAAIKDGGTLHVWNGEGGNRFGPAVEIGGGWSAFSKPVGGDFNNDGIGDLAAIKGGSTLHIWNGEGGNRFGPAVEIGGGWARFDGTLTSIGDVNRDGHDDIAAMSDGTLHVWNGEGGNEFGPAIPIGPGWSLYF
ncbi:FG-GAP repeat domain-containing protein [Nonomuraea sp. GTA35]|uniref:FG-GAP repeat domain-containing protein n=1 Tax=Nonomuraea sp. GTA35 TaxID=1676746 RepID=UPI0035C07CE5